MPDCSELSQTIADIAMNIGADPKVRNIDDVVREMQKEFPEFQREHVVDAIVEATTRGARVQSELSKKLDALKREARRTSEPVIRKRVTDQITELSRKLAADDITPKPRPTPQPLSKEIERLMFERDRARKTIDRKIREAKPKGVFRRVAGAVAEPLNLARSIMTSADLSAVGRQGGFIVIGHPTRAASAFVPMLRAFASERYAWRINNEINARPNAPLYAKSKLYLADQGGTLSAREEGFMSRLGAKIPFVKGSERAYNTFLNKLRADSFDAMTASLSRNGTPTFEESKVVANIINVATGRGSLGSFEQAAQALNTVFFSPRYVASRFQLLTGQPLYGGTARTRKLIAGEYARFALGVGVIYALGIGAGATLEKDPRSSDFGKLKVGDTRIDPLTGLSQNSVLISRMLSGETKSSTTGRVTPIRGKVPFGHDDAWDVGAQFVRGKLSPSVGTGIDLLSGKNVIGQKVSVGGEAAEKITPMAARDIAQAIQAEGVPAGVAMGLLALLGFGVQTYGDQRKPAR